MRNNQKIYKVLTLTWKLQKWLDFGEVLKACL